MHRTIGALLRVDVPACYLHRYHPLASLFPSFALSLPLLPPFPPSQPHFTWYPCILPLSPSPQPAPYAMSVPDIA
eukprot:2282906-Rhodomonas_salina.2